jgi:hypothetical protein
MSKASEENYGKSLSTWMQLSAYTETATYIKPSAVLPLIFSKLSS